jgi:hypothetical protein
MLLAQVKTPASGGMTEKINQDTFAKVSLYNITVFLHGRSEEIFENYCFLLSSTVLGTV